MASRIGRRNDTRYSPYGGSRNDNDRTRARSPVGGRSDQSGGGGWHKIIIPEGANHSRDWLLNMLKRKVSEPFKEISVHTVKETLVFFVDNENAANALQNVSKVITTKDGNKIIIVVKPSDPPKDNQPSRGGYGERGNNRGRRRGGGPFERRPFERKPYNNSEVETLPENLEIFQEFLGKRYDVENIKLDLTELHKDTTLKEGNIDSRIWIPKLMNTILMLVNKLCPKLKILDLSNNRLRGLDVLSSLGEKCPELEDLRLVNNEVGSINELEKVNSCKKLTRLWFNTNPAKEKYDGDDAGYVSAVRKCLPDILELDGVVLPPPITFGLASTESQLPASQMSHTSNKEVSDLVVTFLKNFFDVYDSVDVNDRQQLLEAYHNDAVFSLACNTTIKTNTNHRNLTDYIRLSRNLNILKEKDANFKNTLIKNKKLNVVARLTELPQTKHQLETFTLDVSVTTPHCIVFTVQGMFRDGKDMVPRGFSRTFVVVPQSSATLLIVNDQLHVRPLTEKQIMKLTDQTTTSSGADQNPTVSNNTTEQEQMLQRFSQASGMNLKFSMDCLSSNGWDYDKAANTFSELKTNGKIPPEAFLN